jgi:hypothetical protein
VLELSAGFGPHERGARCRCLDMYIFFWKNIDLMKREELQEDKVKVPYGDSRSYKCTKLLHWPDVAIC